MSPSGDGVVRYVDFKKFFHNRSCLSGRDGLEDGEEHGQRDTRFVMSHFGPGELGGEIGLDAFERVFGDFKGFAG